MKREYSSLCVIAVALLAITLTSHSSFAAARSWIGAGAGGAGTDFNTASNWTGSGALLSTDDLTITMTSAASITLSSSVTVNSLAMSVQVNSGTSYGVLDVQSSILTVNGAASFIGVYYSGGVNDICQLDAGSAGAGFVFGGAVTFDSGGNGDVHFTADVTNPGSLTFRGDVTFAGYSYTTPGDEPEFIYDATGTQNVVCTSALSYLMGESIYVGNSNTPTVNVSGSTAWRLQVYQYDLNVAAGCTLDLSTGCFDNYLASAGSDFLLGAGAALRIGGTGAFPGDNLWSDYNAYTLDPTSTVDYYGSSQTIKGAVLSYGNLLLSGSGTKTSGGSFYIYGDFTANATFAHGNDQHTFGGTLAQNIGGSAGPISFYNFEVSKNAGNLTSSVDLVTTNQFLLDKGNFVIDGETVTNQNQVDIDGGILQITSGNFVMDNNSDTNFDQDGGVFDIDGGTVTLGDLASDDMTDYNLDGGELNISGGTLNIADELDVDGGTVNISGTAVVNVAAHTGSGTGSAISKLDVQSGTFNMTGGSLYLKGAYNNTATYPAMDFNPSSSSVTGGTIFASETGSSDESFFVTTRGNPIHHFEVDKTAGGGASTVTIWNEDFEDLSQGDEADAGSTGWSTQCTGSSPCGLFDTSTGDYFEVRSSTTLGGSYCYSGRDMDNEAKWSSDPVTITGYTNVSVSIDLQESGFDDPGTDDYILVYYQLDGGAETLLTNGSQLGNFGSATATVSGLSGTTLEVHVYMNCNGGSDYGFFDDVLIQGDVAVSTGEVFLGSDIHLNGDMTISSGGLDATSNNYDIQVAGNWSNVGTFVPQNGTVTLDGATAALVSRTTGETFYNLTVNKSSNGVTLADNVTVTNTLTLTDGVVTTGSNRVYVTNTSGSAVTGHSSASFINGNLRLNVANNTETYKLPVGNGTGTGNYYLAEVVNRNLTGITYLDASFGALMGSSALSLTEEGSSYLDIATEGVWTIEPDAVPGGGMYDVRLYLANFGGLTDGMFAPLKRTAGSSDPNDFTCAPCGFGDPGLAATGAPGRITASGYAERRGLTSFSEHGVGKSGTVLPIELLEFTAKPNDQGMVELRWVTATEINNHYFTIERTVDGIYFEAVGTVTGAGNSSVEQSYFLLDRQPYSGESYYRLRQTDFDGRESISDLRIVQLDEVPLTVNVFPNPSSGSEINVHFAGITGSEVANIIVRDMTGRVVHVEQTGLEPGEAINRPLALSQPLAYGTYAITATVGQQQFTELLFVR